MAAAKHESDIELTGYVVSVVGIFEKIGYIITALHCRNFRVYLQDLTIIPATSQYKDGLSRYGRLPLWR